MASTSAPQQLIRLPPVAPSIEDAATEAATFDSIVFVSQLRASFDAGLAKLRAHPAACIAAAAVSSGGAELSPEGFAVARLVFAQQPSSSSQLPRASAVPPQSLAQGDAIVAAARAAAAAADPFTDLRHGLSLALGVCIDPLLEPDSAASADALVDFFVDVFALSTRLSFSDIQLQQLLFLARATHVDVVAGEDTPPNASTSDEAAAALSHHIEVGCAKRLTKALVALCSSRVVRALERTTVHDVVREEKPDPALFAALEAKRPPEGAKNKKAIAAHEEALRNLPRVTVEHRVEREVEAEVDVAMPPYFSHDAVAAIAAFFADTLFAQWRLFRFVARRAQAVRVVDMPVVVQDVPEWSVPPLASALPLAAFEHACERERVVRECAAAITDAFSTCFEVPCAALEPRIAALHVAAVEDIARRAAADRAAAMSDAELRRSVGVLSGRIGKRAAHNDSLPAEPSPGVLPTVAPQLALASVPGPNAGGQVPSASVSPRGKPPANAGKASGALGKSTPLGMAPPPAAAPPAAPAAAASPLSAVSAAAIAAAAADATAVFEISEVEVRLAKLTAVVNRPAVTPAPPGKKK